MVVTDVTFLSHKVAKVLCTSVYMLQMGYMLERDSTYPLDQSYQESTATAQRPNKVTAHRTHHTNIIPIQERLREMRLLFSLGRRLTDSSQPESTKYLSNYTHYSVTSSRTISETGISRCWLRNSRHSLTKSSNPNRIPENSRSLFMMTHIRDPMHLSISSFVWSDEDMFANGIRRT